MKTPSGRVLPDISYEKQGEAEPGAQGDAGTASVRKEDIAIVGMSCCFPGADNYAEFWNNLCGGIDSIGEIPADR